MSVPVIIITGFLGCGKTTFLRHLLPMCGEMGVKPALIINEVGDVDVDGELLADLHTEQIKLVGGCVCCTLQAQLGYTIEEVLEKQEYDLILIECSGLSNPMDVVAALSSPALVREIAVSHIVCLVDASRAEKVLSVADLAKSQVSSANVVILNKADIITQTQRDGTENAIGELTSHARTYWATYGDIGSGHLKRILSENAPMHNGCACGCEHDHNHDENCDSHDHSHSHSLPASFCTVALPLPPKVEREALDAMLKALPDNVIRAKGFAHIEDEGWQVLHRVYTMTDIYPLKGITPSSGAVLICIGQHLSAENISGAVCDALGIIA